MEFKGFKDGDYFGDEEKENNGSRQVVRWFKWIQFHFNTLGISVPKIADQGFRRCIISKDAKKNSVLTNMDWDKRFFQANHLSRS